MSLIITLASGASALSTPASPKRSGHNAAGLFRDLSPYSIDLVPGRQSGTGARRHGEQTASLLAARADGAGTSGIAYEATLLSIRADRDGS